MSVLAQTIQVSLEALGVGVIPIDTHPTPGRMRLPTEFIRKCFVGVKYFLGLSKALKADVIVVVSSSGSYLYAKALPALLLGKVFRRPVVLDFVGGGVVDKLNGKDTILMRCIRSFDCVLVPTRVFERVFLEARIPCQVFPHIVAVERFSPSKKKLTSPVLFAAKNLADESGFEMLLRAFAEIKKTHPEARFIIAGDGPKRPALLELVRELAVSGVEFLGSRSYEEMPALFESATILVHGPRYESFGLVLVEALASGTPVVSTNVGGIPDIINDGVNGFLVDYNDHLSMASRVRTLLDDREVYDRFVVNGLRSAEAYSGRSLCPELIRILTGCKDGST